ncbi:MAG: chaperone modulator CbpM [Gammaproteobacteria bacterium]|jgi:chaperone modulatory protein CbpM
MTQDLKTLLSGDLLDEDVELTLGELCRTCQLPAERVYELVEEGIIEPLGREPAGWRFRWTSVRRVRCALRLEHDLGVNLAGAALALDLLEELNRLRARLRRPG